MSRLVAIVYFVASAAEADQCCYPTCGSSGCNPPGSYCSQSQSNCEANCHGHWCSDSPPTPGPTPAPPGPPTPPPPPTPGGPWQTLNRAMMTHYWDCCKWACSWPGAGSDNTGGALAKTCGGGPNDQSTCGGGPDYACTNTLPWVEGDTLYGWVANQDTGDKSDCGTCFEMKVEGAGGGVTRAIVQLTNKGGMGSDQQGKAVFDFLVPGGGFGQYTGCSGVPGWKVYTDQGGPCNPSSDTPQCAVYGGFKSVDLCQTAFPGDAAAAKACKDVLFGVFPASPWGGPPGNPKITARRTVPCPVSLSSKSGVDGVKQQTTHDWNGLGINASLASITV